MLYNFFKCWAFRFQIFKMKKALLYLALCAVLYSCKKDKSDDLPPAISGFDYLPLDSGNYWIYTWYNIDSNGIETPSFWSNDTIIAEGDTTINGLPYKKLRRNMYGSQIYTKEYYRDSSGVLLDITGTRFLTGNTTLDTMGVSCNVVVPWQCIVYIMDHAAHSRTVPAGTFTVIDRNVGYIDNASTFCNGQHIRYATQTYSKGVGMVTDKVFFNSDPNCEYLEARLLKYYVK